MDLKKVRTLALCPTSENEISINNDIIKIFILLPIVFNYYKINIILTNLRGPRI